MKKFLRYILQKISLKILPKVKVNPSLKYKILGNDEEHTFVGYYDKNPVDQSGKYILCHRVSSNYTKMIEPKEAKIGLVSIQDNSFLELTSTSAMNWQLGSRVQWLDENNIIYNDVIDNTQCSIKFNILTKKKIMQYKRPIWDISVDKKFGASLNFSRIKVKRPGYGYIGKNIDNLNEILTIFDLENDRSIFTISLVEILENIKFEGTINDDLYLNHIVWLPCNKKLIAVFNHENKNLNQRLVFPVMINLETKKIDLINKNGFFSHHTLIDKDRLLAYVKINNKYCFAIWSETTGWKEIKNSMPTLDGHPTYISSIDRVILDSYPNRFGIMSLYFGSINQKDKLEKIASIVNEPQYTGANRCDLHPRYSMKHNLIVSDLPYKNCRRILVIQNNKLN